MAGTKKRFKIIIKGHGDSLSYLSLYWFGSLRGTLIYWLSPKFQVVFPSHPKLLAALGPADKIRGHGEDSILGDVLSLHRNFQETFCNNNCYIYVIKCENATFGNRKQGRQPPEVNLIDEWISYTVFQLFSRFRNFQENRYFTEKSR